MSTTAVQPDMPLRRRIRILERASSLSSLTDAKIIPEMKHHDSVEDIAPSSFTDYESRSDTTGSENEVHEEEEHNEDLEKQGHNHLRPTVDTTNIHRRDVHDTASPMSPKSRAWYEFDLAVVVALVSPVGNWLTGGDHIKNLLLIVLLIFYLHQIIEIPWVLYQQSRRKHPPRHIPQPDPDSVEGRYAQLAASELRAFEFFFLFITFLSPFLGAFFLRYATASVLGPDAVSWFSTGLFVLATGVRPWAHIVERLSQRTTALQEYVHHPSPTHVPSEEQHLLLEKRVAQMEKAFSKIKSKVEHTKEDVYDYVDDAVNAVEHAIRKQERKWDKYEGKVKEVEQAVVTLKNARNAKGNGLRTSISNDLGAIPTFVRSIVGYMIPTWLTVLPTPNLLGVIMSPSALFSANAAVSEPKVRMCTLSGNSSPPLETIFEEEPIKNSNSNSNYPLLARPYSLTSNIVYRIGYIVTLPLRAVVRMILRNY